MKLAASLNGLEVRKLTNLSNLSSLQKSFPRKNDDIASK